MWVLFMHGSTLYTPKYGSLGFEAQCNPLILHIRNGLREMRVLAQRLAKPNCVSFVVLAEFGALTMPLHCHV